MRVNRHSSPNVPAMSSRPPRAVFGVADGCTATPIGAPMSTPAERSNVAIAEDNRFVSRTGRASAVPAGLAGLLAAASRCHQLHLFTQRFSTHTVGGPPGLQGKVQKGFLGWCH